MVVAPERSARALARSSVRLATAMDLGRAPPKWSRTELDHLASADERARAGRQRARRCARSDARPQRPSTPCWRRSRWSSAPPPATAKVFEQLVQQHAQGARLFGVARGVMTSRGSAARRSPSKFARHPGRHGGSRRVQVGIQVGRDLGEREAVETSSQSAGAGWERLLGGEIELGAVAGRLGSPPRAPADPYGPDRCSACPMRSGWNATRSRMTSGAVWWFKPRAKSCMREGGMERAGL